MNKQKRIKRLNSLTDKIINNIKENCLKNSDGVTLNFNGSIVKNKKGYYVSITNIKGKNLNLMIRRVLFLRKYAFSNLKKNLFLGFWKDEQNNKYLDLSLYIENKNLSLNLGKTFKQIAIFDIKNLNCINL